MSQERDSGEYTDPLFENVRDGTIFRDKDMLRVGWVPEDQDLIVGRDEEIETLATYIQPLIRSNQPDHVVVYGKTGTGKSLISRHVARRAREAARSMDIAYEYVDCKQFKTEAQVFAQLALQFNDPAETDQTVPETGLSTARYKQRLWDALNASYDGALIILDEIDKLKTENTVLELSRAVEDQKISIPLGIIAISNRIGYIEDFQARVESSFDPKDIQTGPYDANTLREIMESRSQAFQDDVLTPGVIPKAAALAAQEHGDARKAVQILRHAGELAAREGVDAVTETHVQNARREAEKNRFGETLQNATNQEKLMLLALAQLTTETNQARFKQSLHYDQYTILADTLETNILSQRRFRDLVKDYALLEILETERHNFGFDGGIHRLNRLLVDAEIVKEVIILDEPFKSLRGQFDDLAANPPPDD
jgi:orc1/cdc6 family replication initiation protein